MLTKSIKHVAKWNGYVKTCVVFHYIIASHIRIEQRMAATTVPSVICPWMEIDTSVHSIDHRWIHCRVYNYNKRISNRI